MSMAVSSMQAEGQVFSPACWKANHGGKGQVALFMTLVATGIGQGGQGRNLYPVLAAVWSEHRMAGMNVILFLHYYYLVYTKAANI